MVKVEVIGACGNIITESQLYEIKPVSVLVDFNLTGPAGCIAQNRETNISALVSSNAPVQPVATAFCQNGWLGASSAGIQSSNYTATGGITVNSYSMTVDEVNPTGGTISLLGTYTQSTPLNNYPFKAVTGGYFASNYSTIANTKYYKVTLSVATTQCGTISNYSYFRIISGIGIGSNYWRKAVHSQAGNLQMEAVNVFPNPAIDNVHLSWHNEVAAESKVACILFTDVLGKVALQKEISQQEGDNNVVLDISSLAPGIYHYVLKTASGDYNGKLVKE